MAVQFAAKAASPAPHCEDSLNLLVYPQPLNSSKLNFQLKLMAVQFAAKKSRLVRSQGCSTCSALRNQDQFAAKAASPTPHCEGTPYLLVRP